MTTAFDELQFHLRSLSRCIYYVTDEEDRFLLSLRRTLHADHTLVYNPTMGLIPLVQLVDDWSNRSHTEHAASAQIHGALISIYRDAPRGDRHFYVIMDPERWLTDAHVVRRVLNILHQATVSKQAKILIFVGARRVTIPEKLSPYMEVITDTGLSEDETIKAANAACAAFNEQPVENAASVFKGLNSYQVAMAILQSRKARDGVIDPAYIAEYRKRQLRKTDLVQYMDVGDVSFDQVGGLGRFKEWASKIRHTWTQGGRAAGLEAPRGVLLTGVWGSGKSLAAKAMASTWGVPLVGLEMGRLRATGVGESEANVYKAIRIIESVAPCVVFADEAEKSFAGGQSSGASDAGTLSRQVGILSTWLQETRAQVCFAMTTNSVKTLPIEFVNRADERFFFAMPGLEDRVEILRIHLLARGQKVENFDLQMLAEQADGMVGREIMQVIKAAMVESFVREKNGLDEGILVEQLVSKPRILKTMVDEVEEIIAWVGWSDEANDGVRARYAADPQRSGLRLLPRN